MPSSFARIIKHSWPSGLSASVAIIAQTPEQIELRYRLAFSREVDGLGEFDNCYVKAASGRVFALRRHLYDPEPGTAVLVDESDDLKDALDDLCTTFSFQRDDLSWVASRE